MGELDQKEGWAPKNWCLQTMVLKKTLESPLNCKRIKPVRSKGNQSWIFIGRTDAEAPTFWPPDTKSQLVRKDAEAEKESRRRRGQRRVRSLDSITDYVTGQLSTHTHRDIYNLTFPTILHHSPFPMPFMLPISPYYEILPTYLPQLLLWTHPICWSFIYELVQMPLSP